MYIYVKIGDIGEKRKRCLDFWGMEPPCEIWQSLWAEDLVSWKFLVNTPVPTHRA